MSVRVDQRKESPLLFYKLARELRCKISLDLLAKFPIKTETFTTVDNTVVHQNEHYPEYMVDFLRQDILTILQKLMENISKANAIYPSTEIEVDKRRIFQDYAIGYTEALQNELEYCVDIFPETLRCLLHYADDIDHLNKVLRKWKKSNSKILKQIKGNSLLTSNFANVNNNGNANNNSASNSDNGVRFDLTAERSDFIPEDNKQVKGDCTT